jgi:guanylate kinase
MDKRSYVDDSVSRLLILAKIASRIEDGVVTDLHDAGALLRLIAELQAAEQSAAARRRAGDAFVSEDALARFRALLANVLPRLAPEPLVLIISGASGVGKTTLGRRLLLNHPAEFAWIRRTTTRPRRRDEPEDDPMHRFMDHEEFASNESWLSCITSPFGHRAGFLLDDIAEAALTGRIWVTSVMVQFCELRSMFSGLKWKIVGISPTKYDPTYVTRYRLKVEQTCRARMSSRNENPDAEEVEARVARAWSDTERVYRLADHVIVNGPEDDIRQVYHHFERIIRTITADAWM